MDVVCICIGTRGTLKSYFSSRPCNLTHAPMLQMLQHLWFASMIVAFWRTSSHGPLPQGDSYGGWHYDLTDTDLFDIVMVHFDVGAEPPHCKSPVDPVLFRVAMFDLFVLTCLEIPTLILISLPAFLHINWALYSDCFDRCYVSIKNDEFLARLCIVLNGVVCCLATRVDTFSYCGLDQLLETLRYCRHPITMALCSLVCCRSVGSGEFGSIVFFCKSHHRLPAGITNDFVRWN